LQGRDITISWSRPDDHGSAINRYTLVDTDSGWQYDSHSTATQLTFYNVPAGRHTARVQAWNSVGSSPLSAASNTVTISGPQAPAAPTNVRQTLQGRDITISWSRPDDHGSAINRYTLVDTDSGWQYDSYSTATQLTFYNVPAGRHTARVQAWNSVGSSPLSAASNTVTISGG
jgi:predicted phage tail protein